jgi:vanillate O-demethylase ferredoxin subunit
MNARADLDVMPTDAPAPLYDTMSTHSPHLTLSLRVTARRELNEHIVALELEADDGMPLPAYDAGAHLAIDCRTSAYRTDAAATADPHAPLLRHYSLCGDPSDPMHYVIAIRRETTGRGGSRFLCDTVKPGDLLHASAPPNLFKLRLPTTADTRAPEQILIAGGVGVTPLIAMAWALDNAGIPFVLHEFGRHDTSHVSTALAGNARWQPAVQRHIGRNTDLATLLGAPAPGRHVYVCGPASMIDAVFDTAAALGWPSDHVHTERFAAPGTRADARAVDGSADAGGSSSALVGDAAHDPDGPFVVTLASTGRQIPVAADESACTALSRAGVYIPMSCEQGVCGSCTTRIVSGTPDHRDWILSTEEQATGTVFTPCCSRARSPVLVLDL